MFNGHFESPTKTACTLKVSNVYYTMWATQKKSHINFIIKY